MPDKSSARLSLGEQGRLLPVHPSATMTNRCSLIYLRIEIMHSYSKTAVRFVDRGHSSLESRSKFHAEEVGSGKSDLTCENTYLAFCRNWEGVGVERRASRKYIQTFRELRPHDLGQ